MAYASVSASLKTTQAQKKDEKVAEKPEKTMGDAYSVNISAAAKDAAKNAKVEGAGTEKAKGLTADQVRQLQDMTDQSYTMMIQAMTEIEVTGLTGTMVWDASGMVSKTPMAATIVNGEYVFEN